MYNTIHTIQSSIIHHAGMISPLSHLVQQSSQLESKWARETVWGNSRNKENPPKKMCQYVQGGDVEMRISIYYVSIWISDQKSSSIIIEWIKLGPHGKNKKLRGGAPKRSIRKQINLTSLQATYRRGRWSWPNCAGWGTLRAKGKKKS